MSKNSYRASLSAAHMEPNIGYGSLGKEKVKGFDTPVNITVISYRKRKHDTDGVSVKAVLDGIVRAGLLPDDSSQEVKSITFESRKGDEERTVIEIISAEAE